MGYMKALNIANAELRDCAESLESVCSYANSLDGAALQDLMYNLGQILANRDDTNDLTMAAFGLAVCSYSDDMYLHFNELPDAIECMRNMLNNMNDEN